MLKEYKDLVDDCSVQQVAQFGQARCVGGQFLHKKNPFDYDGNDMIMDAGVGVPLFDGEKWRPIFNTEEINLTPLSLLDTGAAFEYGTDYYVYLCIDGGTPELVVSKNTTFPAGSTALTSIKIGGFHYGTVRKTSEDRVPIGTNSQKFGTNWESNVIDGAILDNSVWDLKNKPQVVMPGLAKVGHTWQSIYQVSLEEAASFVGHLVQDTTANANGLSITSGKLVSKYGKLPATGIEGLNQYNFNELAHRQGMRLPEYAEWLAGAFGSPQGLDGSNNNGWCKKTNTGRTYTGCYVDTSSGNHIAGGGVKPYAISANNLVDCVGNVWEWTQSYATRHPDATTEDPLGWGYKDQLGAGQGMLYEYGLNNLNVLICSGACSVGVCCGPRTVNLQGYPWDVGTTVGARLVCDAA